MARRRIANTAEILLTGIPNKVRDELKDACEGRGFSGKNWSYGELFMTEIYPIWKAMVQKPQGQSGERGGESFGGGVIDQHPAPGTGSGDDKRKSDSHPRKHKQGGQTSS